MEFLLKAASRIVGGVQTGAGEGVWGNHSQNEIHYSRNGGFMSVIPVSVLIWMVY